ncbi:MAG: hypothetical protein EPN93_12245 [Spirochaetes bacterium]|nr:MAG: hypothetical protein EPN93_12245 [Spirochaetota bacterium]
MRALENCLVLKNEIFTVFAPFSTGDYRLNVIPFNTIDTSLFLHRDVESLSLDSRLQINKIQSFGNLPDNWDGYGAARPDSAAIDAAISAVKTFDRYNQKIYFTAPGPSGDILLELKNGDKTIELYYNGSTIENALFKGDECEIESTLKTDEYSDLIRWLTA